MVHNNLRVKMVSRAAVYGTMVHRHKIKRKHFVAGQALLFVLVLVNSFILQAYLQLRPPNYKLDEKTYSLIGQSREDTKEYLKQNEKKTAYEFVVPETTEAELKAHTGRVADAFSATMPAQAKEGITVTENKSKISVKLIPEFYTSEGKKVDGDHVVYPNGSKKLIYTLKYNGLKEDIIIPEFQGDKLDFNFKLHLPSGVEAKLDEQGNIGIYSSDPTLFGNISFGSDEDREKVDKARENGEKNNLVMVIPAPIVKDANGKEYTDKSVFKLSGKKVTETKDIRTDLPAEIPRSMVTANEYQLTIASKNLKNLPYPISIDPTMMVGCNTTTNNKCNSFGDVINEGGTDLSSGADGTISRTSLTGGIICDANGVSAGVCAASGWTNNTASLPSSDNSQSQAVVCVYGNKVFMAGASMANSLSMDISPGTITNIINAGASPQAGVSGTARGRSGGTCYNGYMYVTGGVINNGTAHGTVEYAKMNADGTFSAWSAATSITDRAHHAVVAHNNNIYIIGGCTVTSGFHCTGPGVDNATFRNTINADGSLGNSWTSGTSLPANRGNNNHGAVVYNGYVYFVGGSDRAHPLDTNGDVPQTSVYFTKINSDGSLGAWMSATSLPNATSFAGVTVYAGYLYKLGGESNNTQVLYTQINADGSLGAWRTTTSFATAHAHTPVISHQGYLYSLGASDSSFLGNYSPTIEKAQINPAGVLHASTWNTGGTLSLTADVLGRAATVYNGYMYATGGIQNDATGPLKRVEYAPINSNGSTSSWQQDASSNLVSFRFYHNLVAHNGYLYAIGGCSGAFLFNCTAVENTFEYAPINPDGSLGAWTQSTRLLTMARSMAGGAIYNGYLYMIGGQNGTDNARTTTEYAQISSTGGDVTATGWQAGPTIASSQCASAAAYNGYLYFIGTPASTTSNKVYVSQLSAANGTMGAFSDANATDTNNARNNRFGLAAIKGYLYAWGPDAAAASEYVKINSDGTLGTWQNTQVQSDPGGPFAAYVADENALTTINRTGTTQYQIINHGGSGHMGSLTTLSNMANARKVHAAVAYNGYLYVIGGCAGACTKTATVEVTQIAGDGTLVGWSNTGSLPVAQDSHDAFAYNGYMYVLGGELFGGASTNQVLYAAIGSNGTLSAPPGGSGCTGAWCTTTAFSGARVYHQAINQGPFVYVSGGCSASGCGTMLNDVQYAQINSTNGTIGSWTPTTSFTTTRFLHGSLAYNDYLYIIGGCNDLTPSELNPYGCDNDGFATDVQYAKITTTGALDSNAGCGSTWCTTTSLPTGRYSLDPVAVNGYVYILGATEQDTTIFASIANNGKFSQWQKGTTLATAAPDYPPRAAVYNGRIYITGGANGAGGATQLTGFYPLQSIPRVGSFSKLHDFDYGVKPTKLITRGTKRSGALIGVNYAYTDNLLAVFDPIQNIIDTGYGGSNGQSISLGNQTLSSYFWLRYTIDDSYSAVFPDAGNESTITDFDLYFDANPGQRMRGGRTFAPGNDGKSRDRGLDAAPL